MSEDANCPFCWSHLRRISQLASSNEVLRELYHTYYKQSQSQIKGIKRLHRKIFRLKAMLASAQDKLGEK